MSRTRWIPPAISQAIDRVEVELERPWSLQEMADEARFSTFHFHRMFREAVGETPREMLERIRLERAALLLLADERPITELAMEVGFRRPETFARRFRARFDVSAIDYRRTQIRLWSELGLEAGRDPLGRPGEIRVVAVPESRIEIRRSIGDDEGFVFDPDGPPWSDWEAPADEAQRLGLMLDWPGITPPGHVRQDWGRRLDGRDLADGWLPRTIGGGRYATLTVAGSGPVPPTIYQRLFVWSMAGRYRLRAGPLLEVLREDLIEVCQPVVDTREERGCTSSRSRSTSR